MKGEELLLDKVIITERAKNIVGAPWGSVVENLEWLIKAQLAKAKPLIEDAAFMRGWRKGNELKQKRLDIKLNRARKAERERIINELDSYIKQVVDCNKYKDGYALLDPVALAALDYWWQALKSS